VLQSGTTFVASGNTLTIGGPSAWGYFRTGSTAAIALGVDILIVDVAGTIYNFVPIALPATDSAQVVNLDGSVPNFPPATSATLLCWLQTNTFASDGGVQHRERIIGSSSASDFKGFFHAAPPFRSVLEPEPAYGDKEYARFYARNTTDAVRALEWGGFDYTAYGYVTKGRLRGDGSIDAGMVYNQTQTVAAHNATVSVSDAQFIIWDLTVVFPPSNTASITLNGFDLTSTQKTTKVSVLVLRETDGAVPFPSGFSPVNEVNITATGITSIMQAGDEMLQPLYYGDQHYDLYEGRLFYGGAPAQWRIIWTVTRYKV
jgi:hypothetical protein